MDDVELTLCLMETYKKQINSPIFGSSNLYLLFGN